MIVQCWWMLKYSDWSGHYSWRKTEHDINKTCWLLSRTEYMEWLIDWLNPHYTRFQIYEWFYNCYLYRLLRVLFWKFLIELIVRDNYIGKQCWTEMGIDISLYSPWRVFHIRWRKWWSKQTTDKSNWLRFEWNLDDFHFSHKSTINRNKLFQSFSLQVYGPMHLTNSSVSVT